MKLLLNWILSAVALLIVSSIVGGFYVSGITAALIAVIVIGFVNATLGFFLKIITFPVTLVTFGIFWFVINALMLEFAAAFVPGFAIAGFRVRIHRGYRAQPCESRFQVFHQIGLPRIRSQPPQYQGFGMRMVALIIPNPLSP